MLEPEIQGYESDDTIAAGEGESDVNLAKKKPFPITQLGIIFLAQFSEPLSGSVIYPFIIPLVWHTGITKGDETKVGYYAGAIESAYFLIECMSVMWWSELADRIGRRPVLIMGPLGIALSIFSFSMSNNYWIILLSRCIQGICNGSISGVGKSMMVEITDPMDAPRAFSWVPAVWCAGVTLGPVIGGVLAYPAQKLPESLGKIKYLADHPYFLPCAATGSIGIMSFLYSWCFLRESLIPQQKPFVRARRRGLRSKVDSSTPLFRNADSNVKTYGNATSGAEFRISVHESLPVPGSHEKLQTGIRALFVHPLLVPLINFAFTSYLDQSYQCLIPLVFSTSIARGGLALDPFTIGLAMGTWGLLNALFQVMMFTRVMKWLGPRKMHIFTFSCFLFTFLCFPLLSYFAKRARGPDWKVICVLILQMLFFSVVYMSYACAQLFVLDAVPKGVSMTGVNGLAQVLSTLARGIAPTVTSSLFALSLQQGSGGGYLVYGVLMGITLVGTYMATKSPTHFRTPRN